ncbi:MAG: murein hydrolase activator EnvC family protein [Bacteroidaceae bacterium]
MAMGVVTPTAIAQKRKTTTTTQKKKSTSSKKTTPTKSTKQTTPKVTNDNVKSLKSKRDALQKKINQSQSQLAQTNKDVKKRLAQLSEINGRIDHHQKNISRLKVQIDSVSNNIGTLEAELRTLNAQLKDCKKKYARSMLYMYQNRKASNKMLFYLSASDFTQMARRYKYVKEYSKYQRVQGELMVRKQAEIEEAKTKLTNERNQQNKLLATEQEENRQLTAMQTEQQTMVNGLQKKQKELQRVLANDRKEMADLNAKIDYYVKLAIEQERKRREEAERKRREAAERQAREAERKKREAEQQASSKKNSSKSSAKSKEKFSSRSSETVAEPKYMPNDKEYKLTADFASNRGRLPMPITGGYVISTRYGSYTMPGTNVRLDSKGINLTGNAGAQARCIFDGKVLAVFSAGGMKNVMVSHGSYISIYCNLVSVYVSRDQHVSARQSLGSIAADASGKPNLHFQLRKGDATLNPESWLAR